MSTDIISCLQLDKNISNRLILVKEINRCDSTFIDSCILSHCTKNQTPVIVITTHNSLNHYQNVGLKMNYNLQKYIDSGLVDFYNLGEESVDNLMNNVCCSLQDIFIKIREKILSKQKDYENVIVIMEGVSHLFDLQYTLKEINTLCKQIYDLLMDSNSIFVCHCNETGEEDVTSILSNLLVYKAHTVLEVKSLQSGWSTDVSGHLTVRYPGRKFDPGHMFCLDLKPTAYLFKLFDRGVKLLAPGTV